MSDHSELKRLAEAFPDYDFDSNTEPFFNGPSGESLGGGSTGFYCVYGPDFEIDGDQYDGNTLVEVTTRDQAKFICEAKAGILALIAENEKLKGDLREVKDAKLGLSWAIGEIMGERDQLRTENAGLKTGYEAYEAQNEALRGEVARLQEENENLRTCSSSVNAAVALENEALRKAITAVHESVQREYWDEYAGLEETRAILDAAMGKGAQP